MSFGLDGEGEIWHGHGGHPVMYGRSKSCGNKRLWLKVPSWSGDSGCGYRSLATWEPSWPLEVLGMFKHCKGY